MPRGYRKQEAAGLISEAFGIRSALSRDDGVGEAGSSLKGVCSSGEGFTNCVHAYDKTARMKDLIKQA